MFERLSDGFSSVFRKLSGKGTISESNVREAMTEVRSSLLEADVHVDVVDAFCEAVVNDAVGREVTKSLQPGQEMIGIVHDQLVKFLGGAPDLGTPALRAGRIAFVHPRPPMPLNHPLLNHPHAPHLRHPSKVIPHQIHNHVEFGLILDTRTQVVRAVRNSPRPLDRPRRRQSRRRMVLQK